MSHKNFKLLNKNDKPWSQLKLSVRQLRQGVPQRHQVPQKRLAEISKILAEAIQDNLMILVTLRQIHGSEPKVIYPVKIEQTARSLIGQDIFHNKNVKLDLRDVIDITLA